MKKQVWMLLAIVWAMATGSACQKSITTRTVNETHVVSEKDGLRIEVRPDTPLESHNPGLNLISPRNGSVADNELWVQATLDDWPLGPDPGNHVHLIIDDLPYIALRDLSEPIELFSLVHKELGVDIAPGTHLLRMFASRPQHESVKTAGASAYAVFHVKHASNSLPVNLQRPMLAYSRPKGCNPVDKPVLLDFYLFNWTNRADDDYRISFKIDDHDSAILEHWAPYMIYGLGVGTHKVRLALIDGDDRPLAENFSDTTRTIEVKESCTK